MHSFSEKPYLFLCFRCFFYHYSSLQLEKLTPYMLLWYVLRLCICDLPKATSSILSSSQCFFAYLIRFDPIRVSHMPFSIENAGKKKFRYENCMILCRWFTTESCFSLLSLCVFIFTTIQNNLLYHFMHMNYHMNATIKNERKNEEFFYSKKKRNIKKCCRFI